MPLNEMLSRPCAAQHLGLWMIEPAWFTEALCAVRAGTWPLVEAKEPGEGSQLYAITEDGIAVVPLQGHMTKGRSSYGGASTVEVRQAIRRASQDSDVKGIMLHIDSPGGTVAGTDELADDVYRARSRKPVHAHADDIMASAAYYVGSQASRVTINRAGEVGSIGTVAVLRDYSESDAQRGVKAYVISTGPYKGALADGAPVTEDVLAYVRERVDAANDNFLAAIRRGRGMPIAQVREFAHGDEGGKVWSAKRGLELGLVDAVEPMDAAMAALRSEIRVHDEAREARARNARRRFRAVELS